MDTTDKYIEKALKLFRKDRALPLDLCVILDSRGVDIDELENTIAKEKDFEDKKEGGEDG